MFGHSGSFFFAGGGGVSLVKNFSAPPYLYLVMGFIGNYHFYKFDHWRFLDLNFSILIYKILIIWKHTEINSMKL